jgi:hypothetical protein
MLGTTNPYSLRYTCSECGAKVVVEDIPAQGLMPHCSGGYLKFDRVAYEVPKDDNG